MGTVAVLSAGQLGVGKGGGEPFGMFLSLGRHFVDNGSIEGAGRPRHLPALGGILGGGPRYLVGWVQRLVGGFWRGAPGCRCPVDVCARRSRGVGHVLQRPAQRSGRQPPSASGGGPGQEVVAVFPRCSALPVGKPLRRLGDRLQPGRGQVHSEWRGVDAGEPCGVGASAGGRGLQGGVSGGPEMATRKVDLYGGRRGAREGTKHVYTFFAGRENGHFARNIRHFWICIYVLVPVPYKCVFGFLPDICIYNSCFSFLSARGLNFGVWRFCIYKNLALNDFCIYVFCGAGKWPFRPRHPPFFILYIRFWWPPIQHRFWAC